MESVKEFIKLELKNWNKWEVIWLILANSIILGVSFYCGDTPIGILAAVTGSICVILVGMGRMSNYIFGTINIILYAMVAYKATYYGDVMRNLFYYLPTNILGWFMWKKNINKENGEVIKQKLDLKMEIIIAAISVVGIIAYGYFLKNYTNDKLPYIDSMSTVLSIVAQFLMIKRCMEQWIIWIVVDVVSIFMWVMTFFNGGESIATLLMWIVFLINAIVMFIKWYKESIKAQERENLNYDLSSNN